VYTNIEKTPLLEAVEGGPCGPMVARALINAKLANNHENKMVKHKKVPNWLKNTKLHAKRGSDASTDVIMPLNTGAPISEKADTTRSSRVGKGECA